MTQSTYRPGGDDFYPPKKDNPPGLRKQPQGSGLIIAPCHVGRRCKVCRGRGQRAPGEK